MSSASAPVAPETAPEEPPALERGQVAAADEAALAALYAERRGELLACLVRRTLQWQPSPPPLPGPPDMPA